MTAIIALTCHPSQAGDLPGTVTAETFQNPPNDYRIIQYQMTNGTLKSFPDFDLTFTPGTDTLVVGRFFQKENPSISWSTANKMTSLSPPTVNTPRAVPERSKSSTRPPAKSAAPTFPPNC